MGRNDLCFCGSGKKTKKCHSDIYEKSVVAECMSSFKKWDQYIEDNRDNKPECKEDCAECCYQYFYITQIEFYTILQHLVRNKVDLQSLHDKSVKQLNYLKENYSKEMDFLEKDYGRTLGSYELVNEMIDDTKIFALDIPCVFLDEHNRCSIYQVRPFICRAYGTCKGHGKCPYIDKDVLLDDFEDKMIHIENLNLFQLADGSTRFERPYPIIYWFSEFLERYLQGFDPTYRVATRRSLYEYANRIKRG